MFQRLGFLFFMSLLLAAGSSGSALAETSIRIATWNIAHLYEAYPARFRAYQRTEDDYRRLAAYAAVLDADVIALQEVENAAVAQKVFGDSYSYYFTTRNNRQRVGVAIRNTLTLPRPPEDYTALGLPGGHLRYGLDIALEVNGQSIRLLAVHLKSFCHAAPLISDSKHCARLRDQVPPLENWIEQRVKDGEPMIVLGDFNRRFDIELDAPDGAWMWPLLSDGNPPRQQLVRATQFRRSDCWNARYPLFIDHIVLDAKAARWVQPDSFQQLLYRDSATEDKRLSDHCPISITLSVP